MRRTRKRLIILSLVALVGAAAIATAVYASTRGASVGGVAAGTAGPQGSISISNCKAAFADYITNDNTGLGTTSTTYVPVPAMTKTVTLKKPGCVLVDTSAFAFAPSGGLMLVTATLDGNQGNPIETQFAGDTKGVFAEAHAANFAFAGVSAGPHTVALMFKSLNGSQVFLHRPAMQIDHT